MVITCVSVVLVYDTDTCLQFERLVLHRFYCIVVVEICIFVSGEHVFVDSSTPILVANQIINAGASKSCMPSSRLKDFAFVMNPFTVS